ncbi:GntR family transcriptional regulator [Bacillus sp. APMAM]|nr:GntR family transcriptional regulator [Bacillus sp. APMAM]RTZ55832.1 GntR family transcriptional regulator [Bacillus sp. SAJ1]
MRKIEIVRSTPLHEQIYDILLKQIIQMDLQPGELVVETNLAKKLGVGRGTLREAVRMLLKDGLLVQRSGAIHIYKPSVQDVIEIYQCRERLESLAAQLAAGHMTEEIEHELWRLIVESKNAFLDGRISESVELNTKFHETIIKASHNHQLIALLETIRTKTLFMRSNITRDYYYSSRDTSYIEDHELIFLALKEKDPLKAQQRMSEHILHDLQTFRHFLKEE